MSNELYRDFIDREADDIITSLGGTISVAPPNELYRDFLDRKFTDVINAVNGYKPIKSFTYTGDGANTKRIDIENYNIILDVFANVGGGYEIHLVNPSIVNKSTLFAGIYQAYGASRSYPQCAITWHDDYFVMADSNLNQYFNKNDITYTIYYI